MGEPVTKLTPDEGERVREQISPGDPHQFAFTAVSPNRSWAEDEAEFVVHRPTRREMAHITSYRASGLTSGGLYARDLVNEYDGRYIEIEAWLAVMLDEAPSCWWTKGLDDKPAKKEDRGVTFDAVYNEDLDVLWEKVAPYLESFGITLLTPAQKSSTAPAQ